jgi:hypothetical protein
VGSPQRPQRRRHGRQVLTPAVANPAHAGAFPLPVVRAVRHSLCDNVDPVARLGLDFHPICMSFVIGQYVRPELLSYSRDCVCHVYYYTSTRESSSSFLEEA